MLVPLFMTVDLPGDADPPLGGLFMLPGYSSCEKHNLLRFSIMGLILVLGQDFENLPAGKIAWARELSANR